VKLISETERWYGCKRMQFEERLNQVVGKVTGRLENKILQARQMGGGSGQSFQVPQASSSRCGRPGSRFFLVRQDPPVGTAGRVWAVHSSILLRDIFISLKIIKKKKKFGTKRRSRPLIRGCPK